MPTSTFHNLPEAKRSRFVEVARDEFAHHGYDQASISHIVRRLGIAKGSVYQYFGGKLDLFGFLVEEAGRRKLAHLGARIEPGDVWVELSSAYRDGLAFFAAEPVWSRILLRLLEPSTEVGLRALQAQQRAQAHAYLVGLLERGQRDGVVRPDVDVASAAWLVHGMLSDGLLAAFLAALGTDLESLTTAPFDPEPAAVDRALGVADAAIELLRRGLG